MSIVFYFNLKATNHLCSIVRLYLIVIFLTLLDTSLAVKCFKCDVTPHKYLIENTTFSTPSCSKFDETEDFIVDCPYSTMCEKKILRFQLVNNKIIETVTRGCASQKYTGQVFKQGAWRAEHKVEEPYEEGCQDLNENHLSASTTTYCHCRGNLCNAATKNDPSSNGLHTDAMAVIFVFNAMKYLSSGNTIRY